MTKRIVLVLSMAAACFAGDHPRPVAVASKVYVDSNNGFDIFIQAAFRAKHVNLLLVSSKEQADYVLDSSLFHNQEFIASDKSARSGRTSEAAFKLTSRSGDIVWAYAATKGIFSRGKQSVAEACAKHLKDVVSK